MEPVEQYLNTGKHKLAMIACHECGEKTLLFFNEDNQRIEPASKYWKTLEPLAVFCSPECSLANYTKEKQND